MNRYSLDVPACRSDTAEHHDERRSVVEFRHAAYESVCYILSNKRLFRSSMNGMPSPHCMKTFMVKKTYHALTLLGWLFMCLCFAQGTLLSLVLCFGSGGHIAVEMPHSQAHHPTSQSQSPCLDVPLLIEKPAGQALVVASNPASHAFVPVLMHAASALQWLMAPPCSAPSLGLGFASILLLAFLPPVILRI